jgi:hypothetical protein
MNLHFEIFLEEPSAEAFIMEAWPRICPAGATCQTHAFQGKQELLAKLPGQLKAMIKWIPDHFRIVVLLDEDRQDCAALKKTLERMSHDAGLGTLSAPGKCARVANRIAVEELEAWMLGDPEALRAAFPKLSATFEKAASLRNPDAVKGGTWEALERLLQKSGYYLGGLAKVDCARSVASHIDPDRNVSPSFKIFHRALHRL